jgi:hypothetical protein
MYISRTLEPGNSIKPVRKCNYTPVWSILPGIERERTGLFYKGKIMALSDLSEIEFLEYLQRELYENSNSEELVSIKSTIEDRRSKIYKGN